MPTHIVIRPLAGPSASKSGPFSLQNTVELVIGRDPGAALVFDSVESLSVSRRHAVLKIIAGQVPQFRIADLGSRHGTIVNDRVISIEQDVRPGDSIQLGNGGPKFAFDLYPPDEARPRRGSAAPVHPPVGGGLPAYVDDLEAFAMAAAANGVPSHDQAISGAVPMREASVAQVNQSQTWSYRLVWALVVLGVGGTGLLFLLLLSGT